VKFVEGRPLGATIPGVSPALDWLIRVLDRIAKIADLGGSAALPRGCQASTSQPDLDKALQRVLDSTTAACGGWPSSRDSSARPPPYAPGDGLLTPGPCGGLAMLFGRARVPVQSC
jgi:hypothetical protein